MQTKIEVAKFKKAQESTENTQSDQEIVMDYIMDNDLYPDDIQDSEDEFIKSVLLPYADQLNDYAPEQLRGFVSSKLEARRKNEHAEDEKGVIKDKEEYVESGDETSKERLAQLKIEIASELCIR